MAADFTWIGDRTILYKGRVIELTSHDGWEVVNAIKQIDESERKMCKRMEDGIYFKVEELEKKLKAIEIKFDLIRCKDCKHNKNSEWVDCPITEFFGRTLDNYCSLGERKE